MGWTRRGVVFGTLVLALAQCSPMPLPIQDGRPSPFPPGGQPPTPSLPHRGGLPFQPGVALLTFDDGPHPQVTPSILLDLDRLGRKAVFFMVGNMVQRHPEVARAVVRAGHVVGNHSFSHPALAGRGAAFVRDEIGRTQDAIQVATGVRPMVFRPPYGSYDSDTLAVAAEFGLELVMWDVDTQDYRRPGPSVVASMVRSAAPGAVVLLHDIHPPTASAMKLL